MSLELRVCEQTTAPAGKIGKLPKRLAGLQVGGLLLARRLVARSSDYDAWHADSALAQDRVDGLGDLLGADLLEAVWRAEFSVLLRPWESDHYARAVVRKRAAVFLAGGQPARFPEFVHH